MLPTANFFARIEDIRFGSGSILIWLSTLIILSSAGAKPKLPPQAKQAPVLLTIFSSSRAEKSTLHSVSTTSAVPAALVIALDYVFGKTRPDAAQIETIIGVVLFPAIPPMLCLSTILFPCRCKTSPVLTIALVIQYISSKSIPDS